MPDVGAALQEMRRDAVTQRVARHALLEPGLLRVVAHDLTHLTAVEEAATVGDEEIRRPGAADDRRTPLLQVALDGGRSGARERDVTVLPPLPEEHAHNPLFGVHVVGRELRQLADADARRVEGFEDGAVAQRARGRRLAGRAEEPQHFLLGEDHPRQALLLPRQVDRRRRVLHHVVPAVEEAEEALHHDEILRLARDRVRPPVLLPRGVEVALVREQVVGAHRHQVDAVRVEPEEESPHEGQVLARCPLGEAHLQGVAVETDEPLRPRGQTALLVFVARWRVGG